MKLRFLWISFLLLLLSGCVFLSETAEEEAPVIHWPAPDPGFSKILEAHRDSLNLVMGKQIATVRDTLRFDQPEGSLGNLVSDALRFQAASELRTFVHIGIVDESSFNLFLVPGPLTIGEVYEFMPYSNHLTVLEVNGQRVRKLVQQIAQKGGAPVSGVRFSIDNQNNARGILVDSEVLSDEETYLIATTSYLADGGGPFPALWDVRKRTDLELSIRKLYTEYFRNKVVLTADTDGRIRD